MNSLTVVIVNHNSTDYLEKCLSSLYQQTNLDDLQVVVVDNNSEGHDFSSLEKDFPRLHCVLNSENLGFSMACNQGICSAPADFYLLLNPDCLILDRAVDRCRAYLAKHPEVGILGCRVKNPDGSLQLACRRKIPRPSMAFYRFSRLSLLFPRNTKWAAYNLSYIDDNQTHAVEAVSGSFLMFRHALLQQIGYLDEQFFLYGEDLDFCYRASRKGWKVLYYPEAQIVHYKRRSSSQNVAASTYHFYNAMEIFYRKHFYQGAGRLQRSSVIAAIRFLYWSNRTGHILTGKYQVGSGF